MAEDNKVLLQLGLKGFERDELHALMSKSTAELIAEVEKGNAKIRALQKTQNNLFIKEDRDRVQKQIKAEQDKGGAIIRIMKEQESAVKRFQREVQAANAAGSSSFDRFISRAAHLTTVIQGAVSAAKGMYSGTKQMADEMIRVTNIFANATGSIEGMRQASQGQISDMNLVLARNKAMQLEFKPTEKQFELMAALADDLGDKLGTDAAQGLDKLIEGMALGKTKTLELMLGNIDLQKIYDEFAKKLGTTADKLTDQAKLIAVQEDAFGRMGKKMAESGDSAKTFADTAEESFIKVENAWNRLLVAIGSSKGLGSAVGFVLDSISAALGGTTVDEIQDKAMGRHLDTEKINREAKDAAARARAASRGKLLLPAGVGRGDLVKRGGGGGRGGYEIPEGPYRPDTSPLGGAERAYNDLIGRMGELPEGMDTDRDTLGDLASAENVENMDAMAAALNEADRALLQYLATLESATPVMDLVASAGLQMAGALGESIAATLMGLDEESFADKARLVVRSLSREAMVQAAMQTAKGLAATGEALMGNPAAAAAATQFFQSAAAFAAVGGVAAMAARGMGATAAEREAAARERGVNRPTVPRGGSSFASSGWRDGGRGDGEQPAVIFNMSGLLLGNKGDGGRLIEEMIDAYQRRTGRNIVHGGRN